MADHRQLLSQLQAQGEEFLSSFEILDTAPKKRKKEGNGDKRKMKKIKAIEDAESAEEWYGFGGNASGSSNLIDNDEGSAHGTSKLYDDLLDNSIVCRIRA